MSKVNEDQTVTALRLAVAEGEGYQPTVDSLSGISQSDGVNSSNASFSVISDEDKEEFTFVSVSDYARHKMDRYRSSILTSTSEVSSPFGTPRTPSLSSGHQPSIIEADTDDELETDSTFGDDVSCASSKTSLSSGITKYREENGRRYHAYRDGKYLIPNDEAEQARLDLNHHIYNLILDIKLFIAPVENPQRIYDGGTGTGIWAVDIADMYPEAYVIGSDLSPIQPTWVPPNLEFEIDDIEDPWRHKPFSFIHLRSLSGAIKDWPALLTQAYDHVEPGGWIELTEFESWVDCQNEGDVEPPPMIQKWQEGLIDAGENIGRSFKVAKNLRSWLEMVGFEGVVENVVKVPNAPWPKCPRQKEIGVYQRQNMIDTSSSYGQAHFTRVLGWTKEEYDVLSANVRTELRNPKYHIYSKLYVVYGQKPGLN